MGDDQVKTQGDEVTTRAMPETDTMGDHQVETQCEDADVTAEGDEEVKIPGEGATAGALAETNAITDDQVKVQVEEMDVIVEEVEELKVTDEKTAGTTDAVWDLENTTPKVIDEDLDMTQTPTAALMPNNENVLDYEGMPDLEDESSKEPTGEELQVDNPQ